MYPPPYPPQCDQDKHEGGIPMPAAPRLATVPDGGQQRYYSPNPSNNSMRSIGTTQWSSGLCHCCDDPANCLITCICPCITFGQISEIVNKGQPTCAQSGSSYALLGFTGLACLYSCFFRSKLRAQYDLEEAPFADCLVHFCCETCALCQEYRELKIRGFDMGIGWQANIDRQSRGITAAPPVIGRMTR